MKKKKYRKDDIRYRNARPSIDYKISSLEDTKKFIEFFGNNSFHAKKKKDYEVWKKGFNFWYNLTKKERKLQANVDKMNEFWLESRRIKEWKDGDIDKFIKS